METFFHKWVDLKNSKVVDGKGMDRKSSSILWNTEHTKR